MSNLLASFFADVGEIFTSQKYMSMLFTGLKTTLVISVGAALFGLLLGTLAALVRLQPKSSKAFLIPRIICDVYVTVIRGTPMALQLFIMAFVILTFRGVSGELVAILSFGINSGAYVSENIRAGILSVDGGQSEAGRALGVSAGYTLFRIVVPQGMKNVIPALGNELIALIKETSIVSMIGMQDLTAVAKIIGSGQNLATYLAPMTVVAVFYLAIVYLLTLGIRLIERRLRESEKKE